MEDDARALLRRLARIDARAAVWCACQVARRVLPLALDQQVRPREAIEAAEAWVRREVGPRECRKASSNALVNIGGMGPVRDVAHAAAAAARAARLAHGNSPMLGRTAALVAQNAATGVVRARQEAAPGDEMDRHLAAFFAPAASPGIDGVLASLHDFASELRWPITTPTPTPAQVQAARPALQVAWDAVSEARGGPGDLSVAELVVAFERAEALGLDWSSPIVRAVVERMADEARLRALLA